MRRWIKDAFIHTQKIVLPLCRVHRTYISRCWGTIGSTTGKAARPDIAGFRKSPPKRGVASPARCRISLYCVASPSHKRSGGTLCTCRILYNPRQEADSLCDDALGTLFPGSTSSTGVDLFSALEDHVHNDDTQGDARIFYETYTQEPPSDLCVTEEEYTVAVNFFLDHAVQIAQALSYYSLAGGFARCVNSRYEYRQMSDGTPRSPRIVRTLHAVSYLVPHGERKGVALANAISSEKSASDERTYTRLMETFQFVLEVMGCMAPHLPREHVLPGGEGWKAALRVRMLHGIARRRAKQRFDNSGADDIDFVPINQEDMSATYVA